MRVFRDLDLVEHLGSGVPRILKSYGKECFKFTENFLRMTFPASEQGFIEMTIPDKPNSRLQKYRLTILGKQFKEKLCPNTKTLNTNPHGTMIT